MKGFGLTRNPIKRVGDLYEAWPLTVWELGRSGPAITQKLKKELMDDGGSRRGGAGCNFRSIGAKRDGKYISIFNPEIMSHIFGLYGGEIGPVIYDPFGGGGTRGIMSAYNGYTYIGVELRSEETIAINERLLALKEKYGQPKGTCALFSGCSSNVDVGSNTADTVITCPPYYNMEKYGGGSKDLSMAPTYKSFTARMRKIVKETTRILKPGGLAFWVTGLHRDPNGAIYPINRDLQQIHLSFGYTIREEVILYKCNTSAMQRISTFLRGKHLLIRVHEYLTIFRKGISDVN